jgi:hypothetical protein
MINSNFNVKLKCQVILFQNALFFKKLKYNITLFGIESTILNFTSKFMLIEN